MTVKRFLLFTPLQWVIFVFIKVWVFNNVIFENQGLEQIFFWLLTAAVTAAIVRRLGIMNYLEAIFLIIVWTLSALPVDLVFTASYTGLSIFSDYPYWVGLLFMDLAIFIFHKKRHVQIRREHAAHRAAHKAHGGGHH
jgi:hypothetical protein